MLGQGLFGTGTYAYAINDASGKPKFVLYLLDSGSYDVTGRLKGSYGWIHANQITWYNQTSRAVEKQVWYSLLCFDIHHVAELTLCFCCLFRDASGSGSLEGMPVVKLTGAFCCLKVARVLLMLVSASRYCDI